MKKIKNEEEKRAINFTPGPQKCKIQGFNLIFQLET